MDAGRLAARLTLVGPWLRRLFGRPAVKVPLEAGLGCPNRTPDGTGGCLYCPPGGAGRGSGGVPLDRQLAEGLARLERRAATRGGEPPAALAYYQAHTTTNGPPEAVAALLRPALVEPRVAGVIVGTRPDCLAPGHWEVLVRAAAVKPLWLELGLQSAHDATLAAMGRGHDAAAFDEAAAEAARRGIAVVAHVMLGLPGESLEHGLATARRLARAGVAGVKLHNTMVLAGAGLEDLWRSGCYQPWTRAAYAEAAARFAAHLPRRVVLHRLAADPGPDRLLAPSWAADKDGVLSALADCLEEHDLRQGDLDHD